GVCLIINNEIFSKDPNDHFSRHMENRKGTSVDCQRLKNVFKNLKFIVKINDNLTDVEIVSKLKKYGQRVDHRSYDCFVCCLLTHGKEGKIFGSNGKSVYIKTIMDFFTAESSKTLQGKPKIFFVNACQGKEIQRVTQVETDSVGRNPNRETIPNGTDFLVGFATVPGFACFRSKADGSWYIQCLCEVLTEFAQSEDLLGILTEVNKRVSKHTYDDLAQCPAPSYSLRKKMYFCDRTLIDRTTKT
ncbi:hypothetical protein CAPTEDRAFT_112689, partial [Capitella teleta]